MTGATSVDAESPDGRIDDEIYACLDLIKPISFFLYAGAGSGKTRSVVNVVNRLRRESGRRLLLRGQHIGVITYTNAACDEIKRRLEFDPLVEVSTIHSFAWALVSGFQPDIRAWLRTSLVDRIAELEGERARGRAGPSWAGERPK